MSDWPPVFELRKLNFSLVHPGRLTSLVCLEKALNQLHFWN